MRSRTTILSLLLCFLNNRSSDAPIIPHIPEKNVSISLYGSVTLPCTFPFIQSLEGLSMIWVKEENGIRQIVYWILEGKENLTEQHPRYRGRVELSTEFSHGNLDLILRDVTYEDEGTYYCRAAYIYHDGDKKVTLSIDGLDADNPIVTLVTIDGKRRWKCTGSSDYHNPQVQWITTAGEDLSSYGRLSITEESNGRKLVESVLDYELDAKVLCHIRERKLKEYGHGDISDNEEKKESHIPVIIICAVIGTNILIIIIIIIIIRLKMLYNGKSKYKPPSPDLTSISYDILRKKDSDKAPTTDSPCNDDDVNFCRSSRINATYVQGHPEIRDPEAEMDS